MGTNIELKDLYSEEQTYEDIGTVAVPKADDSGNEYYVKRPVINYTLLDPPTHEIAPTQAQDIFAWNAGDGTLLGVLDGGNLFGAAYASAAGKTTQPIISIVTWKHLTGIAVNSGNRAHIIYLYEELAGSVLQEVISYAGSNDFIAQVGWGQLLLDDNNSVTGYAKIDDPSAVSIGIEQPNGIINADIFYALLSEVTQEEQSVSVTENGAQTIVPAAGKSGIRKVALNVNVPSSGGNLQEKAVTFTANGTQEVTPDEGYDGMSKLTAMVNVAGGIDAKSWVFTNGVASISQADFNKYLAPGVIAAVFINVPLEPVGGTGYSQMQNVMRSESSDGSAQLVFAGEEYSLDETSDPKILTPTVGGFGIISRASADADFVLSYVNAYGNTITPAFTSNDVQVTLYAQLLQL